MSDLTLSDFTLGMRVRIDDVITTRGAHFIPSFPGNTGTVVSLEEDTDTVVIDLDDVVDGLEELRTPEILAQNAESRKNWKFGPKELLIENALVTSD